MKKKILILICCLTVIGSFIFYMRLCQRINTLPEQAKEFIKQYFPEQSIAHIDEEEGFWLWTTYEIILTDGSDLKFDHKGKWLEVDCQRSLVPHIIIPKNIQEYVTQNFSGQTIVSIKKEWRKIEIQFLDGRELIFNKEGKFLYFD